MFHAPSLQANAISWLLADRVCRGVYLHACVPFPLFRKSALPAGVSARDHRRARVRRRCLESFQPHTPPCKTHYTLDGMEAYYAGYLFMRAACELPRGRLHCRVSGYLLLWGRHFALSPSLPSCPVPGEGVCRRIRDGIGKGSRPHPELCSRRRSSESVGYRPPSASSLSTVPHGVLPSPSPPQSQAPSVFLGQLGGERRAELTPGNHPR